MTDKPESPTEKRTDKIQGWCLGIFFFVLFTFVCLPYIASEVNPNDAKEALNAIAEDIGQGFMYCLQWWANLFS